MFYYNPEEGWKHHLKKIKFKEYKETYGASDEEYLNNDIYSEIVSTDVVLTDLQKSRLSTIRSIPSMGIQDIEAYVLRGVVEDQGLVMLKEEVKAEETRQKLANLIRWDELTTEEMLDFANDFKEYEVGAFYVEGYIFNYNAQLYKALQAHTSQEDWKPDEVPTLYKAIAPPSVIAKWKQPTGAHDAYNKGDRVTFEGQAYESLIDGNTWSPVAYPQGWKEI